MQQSRDALILHAKFWKNTLVKAKSKMLEKYVENWKNVAPRYDNLAHFV